ncbi:hypothetical protein SKAU_G00142240 [Synaphobranchus kaupii]|uniref:Multimerin-2 n=1 Tax=Synaphobranchus kaupii TaxID=118154 RepID=A0A9Q1FTK6_SYNKA|nr:hypothetical protein SKAU_G00142240 [Synaphobranchus kaupii]
MARVLLLLVGFLLEALCDIRARDPEIEEDRDEGHAAWDRVLPQRFGTHGNRPSVPGYGPLPAGPVHPYVGSPEESAPPSGDFQNYAPRTGNWCGFVHQRTVTTAMHLGSERYIAKSLSPCPIGPPDCQLVLYKLSVRPVYKERQKVVTSLLWSCCPGYGGNDCEVTAADAHASDPRDRTPGDPREGLGDAQHQGSARQTQPSEDLSLEQSDFQPPGDPLGNSPNPAASPHDVKLTGEARVGVASAALPTPPNSGTPPVHHTTVALMAQLYPVLDGFNRTLTRLSQEVGRLSNGLAELQRDQQGGASHGRGGGGGGRRGGHTLEARLRESTSQIGQVRALLSARQNELEGQLQSQHAVLHHHLTAFKADADSKIGQNQASLLSLNATLAAVRLKQRRLEEAVNGRANRGGGQPWSEAAVLEVVGRLASKVASNTAKVAALEEKSDRATRHLGDLHRGLRGLEGKLAQTGRKTQAHFTDTSMDVEEARVAVLDRVGELADNLTTHKEQLSDLDSDMKYLHERLDGDRSRPSCDCPALAGAVSELRRSVASAAETAEENRRALERVTGGEGHWEGSWDGSLSDLRQGLRQVREFLASEQDRGRAAGLNMSRLQAAQQQSQQDVLALLQRDAEKTKEMRRLSGSFSSLLKDAIRHSEVLEVLLGEEVLQFKELPSQEQREYSIPLLRRRILLAQEQIESHAVTLAALGSPVVNDDPSAATSGRFKRESDVGYGLEDYPVGDFWSLGREVEELEARLRQLEGQSSPSRCCNCTTHTTAAAAPTGPAVELQDEVVALRRGLEDHLRVFQNVFGNTGGPALPNGTLDLDRLWAAIGGKEGKTEKQRKDKDMRDGHRAGMVNPRSKRETAPKAADLSQFPDASVAFLASTHDSTKRPGPLIFERVSLNQGRAYSARTGVFRAPHTGLYLFLLTLDFGQGPAAAVLKREGVPAATLRRGRREAGGAASRVCALELRQGEQVYLELAQGTVGHGSPTGNTFAGLLLLRTT